MGSLSSRSMIWLPMLSAPELVEDLLLALLGLMLDALPGRLLGAHPYLGRVLPVALPRILRTRSMRTSRSRRRRSTLPKAFTTTRVSSTSFSSVNSSSLTSTTSLTEMSPSAQRVAQLAEALEGQVGREDGVGDLVLALLDPLGQRDLALAREQGHPAHLAQVEAHRILGAPDRAGREVDRLAGRRRRRRPARAAGDADLGGQAAGLGRVDHLDVHRAEHHHDVVELVERHDVRRAGRRSPRRR